MKRILSAWVVFLLVFASAVNASSIQELLDDINQPVIVDLDAVQKFFRQRLFRNRCSVI